MLGRPPPDIAGDRAIGDLWSYEQFIASPGPKHYGEGNPPPPSAATLAASKAKAAAIAAGGDNDAAWRAALNVLRGSQSANRARIAAYQASLPKPTPTHDEYGQAIGYGYTQPPPKPTLANASGSNVDTAKALTWVLFLAGQPWGPQHQRQKSHLELEDRLRPYILYLTEAGLSSDPKDREKKLTNIMGEIAEELDIDINDIPDRDKYTKLFSSPKIQVAFGAFVGIVKHMMSSGIKTRAQKKKNQNAQNLASIFPAKGGARRNKRRSRKHKRKSRKNRKTSRR
jgi:hypothetical protein